MLRTDFIKKALKNISKEKDMSSDDFFGKNKQEIKGQDLLNLVATFQENMSNKYEAQDDHLIEKMSDYDKAVYLHLRYLIMNELIFDKSNKDISAYIKFIYCVDADKEKELALKHNCIPLQTQLYKALSIQNCPKIAILLENIFYKKNIKPGASVDHLYQLVVFVNDFPPHKIMMETDADSPDKEKLNDCLRRLIILLESTPLTIDSPINNLLRKYMFIFTSMDAPQIKVINKMLNGKNRAIQLPTEEQLTDLKITDNKKDAIKKLLFIDLTPLTKATSDRLKMQLIERVMSPHLINQDEESVCGVVVFLNWLIQKDPMAYVDFALDLICHHKATKPFLVKNIYTNEELNNIDVDQLLLHSIRNQQNILPYYKGLFGHIFLEPLEQILAITHSYEIVDWIKKYFVNCTNNKECHIIDTTVYLDDTTKEPIGPIKEQLFQISSENRSKFSNLNENFEEVYEYFQKGCGIILLCDMKLAHFLAYQHHLEEKHSVFGIEYTHYISIDNISIKNNMLLITGNTWGKQFSTEVSLSEFMKGYRGCIITPPIATLNLEEKMTMKKE